MIQELAARHQKKVALSLFFLFYLELAAPGIKRLFAAPIDNSLNNTGLKFSPVEELIKHRNPISTVAEQLGNKKEAIENTVAIEEASPSIGGPGQPEMSSFQSVNSNDMVDLFSGDFSYNIPLMDVGGYPVNIHYSGNVSMDQEASWVGLGWNVNPGTISRSVRGMPDDFNGNDSIEKTQSVKDNRTVGVTVGADLEVIGLPMTKLKLKDSTASGKISLGASLGVFHNTYNGFGTEFGVNASISVGAKSMGDLSGSLGLNSNSQSGVSLSPSVSYTLRSKDKDEQGRMSMGLSTNFNTRSGISALQLNTGVRLEKKYTEEKNKEKSANIGVPSAAISFAMPTYTPSIGMPYTSTNYSFRGRLGGEFFGFNGSLMLEGYVSKQQIKDADKTQKKPALGYLYFSKANNNTNTLLDFNRDRDVAYTPNKTPNIAIPQFTYDVYSISGEGTGGMFRPYRGDLGFVRDAYMKTKSSSDKLSIDLGFGNAFHGGVDFAFTRSFSENNPWLYENDMARYLKFRESDTTFEAVYFRNPGEKTTNSQAYYNSIGDDQLIRARLTGKKANVKAGSSFMKFQNDKYTGEVNVTAPIVKAQRDKRTQIISYLNAQEASIYGLEKNILSYKENSIPGISCADTATVLTRVDGVIRKKHHLSQITVLNGDGRRYVYGIPAYNIEQRDVTFSVEKENNTDNLNKGLAEYNPGSDNTTGNGKGKEGYFSKDITPAHAHSFLLTGIVSTDYVDLKNDGISEDDMGDAVKFNYTRVYGDSGNHFKWRTPFDLNKANYNEGLKSYKRDDKGSYMYGEKEVWYLNSIESKTMVAVFKVANDRKDIYSVSGENGGLDVTKKMRRLKQIDLFVKADLVKDSTKAKPVKTVHFAYSYSLCKGIAGDSDFGKLTLDSIWFSYNGNEKGKLNPYVFKYNSFNPTYNPKHYDRWGNYKDPEKNLKPNQSNADFPYAQQDSTLAAKYATAWALTEVQLPSGGKIKVTYEADDYGYVQAKRATQFFKIAGIGEAGSSAPAKKLYDFTKDYNCVFIKSSVPLQTKKDVYEKFLQGLDYIYFRLAVNVPADIWGGGIEYVPVYAEIEDYGLGTGNRFWIKLKNVEGMGPLSRSALEFLRLNLPSKAYPKSEPGDDMDVWDVVKLMGNSIKELVTATANYNTKARIGGYCQTIDTSQSYVRLNNPSLKKYGGGQRVKKVEVYDSWKKMTGQKESVYGQEYTYTKTEQLNGKEVVISSGVASYEPMIGAEENPFRIPIPYSEKIAPGAPVNHLFVEQPLGESYFPSASIGYSKVRVRTINAKAKSANGWQETEYFTTKDFPTIVENTIIDEDAKEQYRPKLANFLRIDSKSFMTLSQGFRVELNDMNGKVKGQASFAETDPKNPISYVRNYYKVDNDSSYQKRLNNSVWTVDSINGKINKNGIVGKDIEVMIDLREQYSMTSSGDFGVNIDFSMAGIFPVFLPSGIPMPQLEQTRYRSMAVVKIVQRYGILDSVIAMDKGSIVTTKNLVYDGETGEVVLSRTNNEFKDPIFNFSYPAHWAYSGMGMAYQNIDAIFKNLKLIEGKLYYGGNSTTPYPVERFFESGDEVLLTATLRSKQTGSGAECLQFAVIPFGSPRPTVVPMRAWVMDASKGKEGDKGLYFIDGEGNPLTLQVDYMRIIRSGHRNLLDASVGSIVSMANPVKDLGEAGVKLVFDTSTKVVNTSAVTYKDLWRTEKFVYPKDTVYKVYRNYTKVFVPTEVTNKRYDSKYNETSTITKSKNVAASFDFIRRRDCYSPRYLRVKSIMNFDLSRIPNDAIVLSAKFDFSNKNPNELWDVKKSSGTPCQANYSFNWSAASSNHVGTSLSYLRRVTKEWNASTPYNSIFTTNSNQVAVDYNSATNLSCSNLIQDVISNDNYGLVMEVNKVNPSSSTSDETNYLNFCAQSSNTCIAPLLTVNYKALEDSIANRCRVLGEDSIVNPYRLGLLGNWRVDRAYTFYHDRKESDAGVTTTNIRREGLLKEFSTFWKFTDSVLLPLPDTAKWVWNSASSLYSKKGFEIENYDPLGRYNAGIYGYNGTLPIAVAQNSKYREVLFDGFEDYYYKSEVCSLCETPREIDFRRGNSGVWLTDTISHTGLSSLKVTAGFQGSITAPVIVSDSVVSLSMVVDSSVNNTIVVNGYGTGLTTSFSGYSSAGSCPEYIDGQTTTTLNDMLLPLDLSWGNGAPSGLCSQWFSAQWPAGRLQAPYSDYYTFYGISDGSFQVHMQGQGSILEALNPNVLTVGKTVYLEKGEFYLFTGNYLHSNSSNAYVQLRWSRTGNPGKIETIPLNLLYPDKPEPDKALTLDTIPMNCINVSGIKPSNFLRPNFSPTYDSKIVVSGWVKMDGNDCNTAPALDSVLKVVIHQTWNSEDHQYLKKTGVRIEGWQRYEGVIVLSNAAQVSITAVAPSGRNIFVDDIRFQPYNSSMKSYAYNPINLRLMAELDENNYATFYEYDDDGTLIRVKKETERGVMTIKETRSALLKTN